MLIAIFTVLLLGGGGSSTLEYIGNTADAVKIVVPKGDLQKAALSTLNAMKKRTSAHNKIFKRTTKDIARAIRDRDTTADDLDAIWTEYFVGLNQYNHDMLDLRFELKASISREEWQEIFQDSE